MKVSVAMCTYNGEKYLKKQLDSILNQTKSVDEIIICDDGSTDRTMAILNDYAEKHNEVVRVFQNEKNLRVIKNFEKAVEHCTGDIVFLSDQDDIWAENKVENFMSYFSQNPSINVLGSNGYCIDENDKVYDKYSVWDVPSTLLKKGKKIDYLETLVFAGNIFTGASMAFRKEILPEILPFPDSKTLYHDGWIALYGAKKKSIELLPEKYFYYRIHEEQQIGGVFFSKDKEDSLFDFFNFESHTNKERDFNYYKAKVKTLCFKSTEFADLIKNNPEEKNPNYTILKYCYDLIATYHKAYQKSMRKDSLIRFYFLKLIDKFTNKRQFTKL